ncbi:MAG: protease inhibitor I42 family protein [Verrucomicrobia bacterium]|nr:protease inhibitor I42 family protein [Verrucomicrobiota bacterium]MBU4291540.1 protease inhibitor I42 family protein [Verrucomicrobiota bacterium]MBU4429109.1 protease inhibitor I42 family protein [Verrucomicrobiota bacterium]MCG2678627.1 protease inhibitor I42 family protein [Kiritimatiellia bacterium]
MAANSAAERIEEYLNPGEPIRVTAGRKFSISIAANPTTGYGWQLAKPMDETVAVLITNSYVQDQTDMLRVGGGGHEVWIFKAIGQGQAAISLKYVRPWEKDVAPARTNVFTVIVK